MLKQVWVYADEKSVFVCTAKRLTIKWSKQKEYIHRDVVMRAMTEYGSSIHQHHISGEKCPTSTEVLEAELKDD